MILYLNLEERVDGDFSRALRRVFLKRICVRMRKDLAFSRLFKRPVPTDHAPFLQTFDPLVHGRDRFTSRATRFRHMRPSANSTRTIRSTESKACPPWSRGFHYDL